MKRLCFATGNFYIPGKTDINKDITRTLKLGIDGVEITIGKVTDILKFRLNTRNKKELKRLDYNSIHTPFYLFQKKTVNRRMYYWNTKYCKKLLSKIHKIYDDINAINLNFHPNLIKNFKLLEDDNYNYSIENMTPHWRNNLNYYKKILNENPHISFLLDTSHAILCNQLDDLVKMYKRRIRHVHLSNVINGVDHRFLHASSKKELKKLKIVKKLNVPFIIESWYEDEEAFNKFKKEVNFVRKWLK